MVNIYLSAALLFHQHLLLEWSFFQDNLLLFESCLFFVQETMQRRISRLFIPEVTHTEVLLATLECFCGLGYCTVNRWLLIICDLGLECAFSSTILIFLPHPPNIFSTCFSSHFVHVTKDCMVKSAMYKHKMFSEFQQHVQKKKVKPGYFKTYLCGGIYTII